MQLQFLIGLLSVTEVGEALKEEADVDYTGCLDGMYVVSFDG